MRDLDDGLRATENLARAVEKPHFREEFRWKNFQACRGVRRLQRDERVTA